MIYKCYVGDDIVLNIVICDDNVEFSDKVSRELKKEFENDIIIYKFYKYDVNFKNYIEKNTVPAIFILDIDLNNKNTDGYDIAKKIRKTRNYNDEIIFLTNDTLMSPNIIKHKIQPIDFIIKSEYGLGELVAAIKKGNREIITRQEETDTGVLIVYQNKACYKLKYKYILYIKLREDSRSVLIKMQPNYMEGELEVVSSINSIMKKLDNRFFQISRTTLVNKDFVILADPVDKKVGLKFDYELEGSEDKIRELVKWIK